jgi:adenosylmethionine-8-amino-7-oxononanoate aminotransferase
MTVCLSLETAHLFCEVSRLRRAFWQNPFAIINNRVFYILPPYIITQTQLQKIYTVVEAALDEVQII